MMSPITTVVTLLAYGTEITAQTSMLAGRADNDGADNYSETNETDRKRTIEKMFFNSLGKSALYDIFLTTNEIYS